MGQRKLVRMSDTQQSKAYSGEIQTCRKLVQNTSVSGGPETPLVVLLSPGWEESFFRAADKVNVEETTTHPTHPAPEPLFLSCRCTAGLKHDHLTPPGLGLTVSRGRVMTIHMWTQATRSGSLEAQPRSPALPPRLASCPACRIPCPGPCGKPCGTDAASLAPVIVWTTTSQTPSLQMGFRCVRNKALQT